MFSRDWFCSAISGGVDADASMTIPLARQPPLMDYPSTSNLQRHLHPHQQMKNVSQKRANTYTSLNNKEKKQNNQTVRSTPIVQQKRGKKEGNRAGNMKIKFPPAFCSCSKASSFSSSSQKSTSEIDDERETKLVVENGWPARSDRLFNRVSDDPFVPFLFLGFCFVFKWETMKDSQHDTSNETSRCGRYRICRREKKTKMRFGGNQIIDCS